MNFISILTLSLTVHTFFLFQFDITNTHKDKEFKKKTTLIKLKQSIKSKKKVVRKTLSWSKLGIAAKEFQEVEQIQEFGDNEEGSNKLNLYNKISQGISFPSVLAQRNISGKVHVKIYLNKKGEYIEELSHFKSNSNYFKIHVRRILRKTLSVPTKVIGSKRGLYNATFYFHLTTGLALTEARDSTLYFYIKRYGGDNGIDKFNKSFGNIIGGVSNVLSLLKYLPSNRKKSQIIGDTHLLNYQSDKYWGR